MSSESEPDSSPSPSPSPFQSRSPSLSPASSLSRSYSPLLPPSSTPSVPSTTSASSNRLNINPPAFWDSLSRQWLTLRALREFDRRTVRFSQPQPPAPSTLREVNILQLKRFARHGGPNINEMIAYSNFSTKERAPSETKTRRRSAYDAAFQQHLVDYRIFMEEGPGLEKPSNIKAIKKMLSAPRPSLTSIFIIQPAFQAFVSARRAAANEPRTTDQALLLIAGKARFRTQRSIRFTNLCDLTDGSIITGRPDFYDGEQSRKLSKRVRNELSKYIIPSKNKKNPCLPNFFTEAKGGSKSPRVSWRQACYHGTLGARGMDMLRCYIDSEKFLETDAYTITSTYNTEAGLLTLYTIHAVRTANSNSTIQYQMTQLGQWDMASTSISFREGASAYRNARDWAKEQRCRFIAAANAKAQSLDATVPS